MGKNTCLLCILCNASYYKCSFVFVSLGVSLFQRTDHANMCCLFWQSFHIYNNPRISCQFYRYSSHPSPPHQFCLDVLQSSLMAALRVLCKCLGALSVSGIFCNFAGLYIGLPTFLAGEKKNIRICNERGKASNLLLHSIC